jgi:hypothetical protein
MRWIVRQAGSFEQLLWDQAHSAPDGEEAVFTFPAGRWSKACSRAIVWSETRCMEQLAIFISSRGILKSCASHNEVPFSSEPCIDDGLLKHHRSGNSIYVCTDALRNFCENFLPHLHEPFVLISGDSDAAISEPFIAEPAIATILENTYLLRWYAQNLSTHHTKLFHLPIGLDYHTMWERPGLWGASAISPIAQENVLQNMLAFSPQFNQRRLAAYCNWHFAIGRGTRQECLEKSEKSVCLYETHAVPRDSTWQRQAECMFVLSPEGAGMDCHRTWEALLLGCIPIIKRNALSGLFADLPAMIVDDWQQVHRETMVDYIRALPDRKFDFSSLFRDYWMRSIHTGEARPLLHPMTHEEFRALITRKT